MNDDVVDATETRTIRRFWTTHRTLRCAFVTSSIAAASLWLAVAGKASAESLCVGTATRATPAVDAAFQVHPGAIDRTMPRVVSGEKVDDMTVYVVGPSKRDGTYCVSGGPCYPATAIALSNCTIGPGTTDSNGVVEHDLEPIRSMFSAVILKRYDTDHELQHLGVSSASAFGEADTYARHPTSRCGRSVAAALHGEAAALRTLVESPQTVCPD